MSSIRLERVSFAFHDAAPILEDVTLTLPAGWTGLVGENGTGKTTLLRLLAGALQPDSGRVRFEPEPARVVLCPQTVEERGEDVGALAEREDGEARRIRGELRLDPRDLERWRTLSPGERKRWQVGAALAGEPDVLLLDEPTNHADARMRALLVAALARFRGAGVVVSHDRALLEELTDRTLRLAQGQARLHGGTYAAAREVWQADRAAAWSRRAEAQDEARRAKEKLADARRRRDSAERALSNRGRDPKDSDARSIMARNLKSWAEARAGLVVNRARSAAERAAGAIPDAPIDVELGRSVFLGYSPAPKPVLMRLDTGALRAGDRVVLREVHVQLGREDRIRIAGPNGAGKTTLLTALLDASGLDAGRVLYIPQETPLDEGAELLDEVRRLPPEVRGRVFSLVAALGTDPARLLASAAPSPGELRKLHLALGLGRHVWALVLDEPTNHLDLPTVERLENALAGYPGALLLVSHDDAFAARCTTRTWRLEGGALEQG